MYRKRLFSIHVGGTCIVRLKRGLLLRIGLPHQRDRLLQQGLQHLHVDVLQSLHVEASLGGLVLAKPRYQLRLLREGAGHEVDRHVGFAWTESSQGCIAFMTARVGVVIDTEADDRGSPHMGLRAGELVHQLHQRAAVVAHGLAGLLGNEGFDTGGGGVGLVGLGHERAPALTANASRAG